jgi:putative transposase
VSCSLEPNLQYPHDSKPSSYSALYYHLIWSTKYRTPLIQPEWKDDLYAYIGGIVRNEGNKLLKAGGTSDHIHLLCSLGRESTISDILRAIKTNSSKWVRETLAPNFQWQDGYAAFSVSRGAIPDVERYLANQEQHHATISFEDEMRRIFKQCGIEFDERFFEKRV